MQWASDNFSDKDFYTSADDDMMFDLVGLANLIFWFQEKKSRQNWPEFPIICSYKTRVDDWPDRKTNDKWYIPYVEYKWPYWPDYCLGGAYTTSVRVVRDLWKASLDVEPLRMDDVYITGILREKIGMPRQFVQKLDVPVAKHYTGFGNIARQPKNSFMKNEWDALKSTFKNATICQCG